MKQDPGAGISPSASAERSFVPMEEPPERITASCSARRRWTAARRAAASSATIPARVTSQPVAAISAASAIWLASRTWPGRGVASGAQSSFPVDSTATRGRRKTSTVTMPKVARSARLAARNRRPAGRTASPRVKSSPAWTTLAPAATARETSMRAPPPLPSPLPPRGAVCSTITTASASAGRKPPVGDLHRLARRHSSVEDVAHRHRPDDVQHDQRKLGGGVDVGGVHREAVHHLSPLGGRLSGAAKACARTRPSAAVSGTLS